MSNAPEALAGAEVTAPLRLVDTLRVVIGGTSLFGGRGKMSHAIIGGIILAVIANGPSLIQVSQTMEYVVTGLVFQGVVESLARRSQTTPR